MYGCVGVLDVISIRIRKPRNSACSDPASYFRRKVYYAVPGQAICDSKYRFTFFSEKYACPTHDSTAFSISSACSSLADGHLRQQYWIAANDASACNENIITPVSGAESTT